MPVVQRIRCQAQRYSGSPFLSSLVFVRLTGVKWIRPGNHSPRLCLAWRAKRFILRGLMAESFQHLLKATSRSFYLTLRVLPARMRPQIGLAYLLARTTDTIADTEIVPLAQGLDGLKNPRDRIPGGPSAPLNSRDLARQQGSPAEKLLLEKVEDG